MADSTGHTARNIMQAMNKDILRELYVKEDIVADYMRLREIIADPEVQVKDKIATIKMIWEYTIAKPKQELDVTSGGVNLNGIDLSKLTNEQLGVITGITQSISTGENQSN